MPILKGPLVVSLVYDGLCTFEFGIAAEIFGLPRPEMGENWYRFASCAIDAGPLRAHGGLTIHTDGKIGLLEKADLIVIPGWKGVDVPVPQKLCDRLKKAHVRGARIASICSGAFVLAATGLLDGSVATTHWRYADDLRRRFPSIDVDETSLYRSSQRIYTSAGSAAGIDMLIDIVRQDFGPAAANSVARRIVMPAHRSGGQAQFLERPVSLRENAAIAPLLEVIRTCLAEAWTIDRMARQINMSQRTFIRRFIDASGCSPGEWLINERVHAAKSFLCEYSSPMEDIASAVGFGSAQVLRHHFRQRVGISPTKYRASFNN